MCGEAAAVPSVFGILDHQALVLGNLEATDPAHQLSTARREHYVRPTVLRVGKEDPLGKSGAPHHLLGVYCLRPTNGQKDR